MEGAGQPTPEQLNQGPKFNCVEAGFRKLGNQTKVILVVSVKDLSVKS